MDKITNPIRLLIVAALLLFASATAFAEQAGNDDQRFEESQNVIQSIFDADVVFEGENKDLAHSYFAQLFGEFIFVNWGVGDADDVTLLSRVLGFTNILALILGIVIVYYVIVGGAVNTAQAGEVLGKSWSSVWLPLRTAAGFGSIMPANLGDGNPFSVAQIFILWLIMIGSNGATVLWNSAVDTMASGASPSLTMHPVPQTDAIEMFNILMCTEHQLSYWGRDLSEPQVAAKVYGLNGYVEQTRPGGASSRVSKQSSLELTTTAESQSIKNIDFSKFSNGAVFVSEITFARGCGTITLPKPPDGLTGLLDIGEGLEGRDERFGTDSPVASDYKVKAQWNTVRGTYSTIGQSLNSARDLVIKVRELTNTGGSKETAFYKKLGKKESDSIEVLEAIGKDLNGVAFAYSSNLGEAINSGVNTSIGQESGLADQMKKGGWVIAGKWFYEMGASGEIKNSLVKLLSGTSSYQSPELCETKDDKFWWFSSGDENCEEYKSDYSHSQRLLSEYQRSAIAYAKANNQKLALSEEILEVCTEDACNNDDSIVDRLSTSMGSKILNFLSDGDVRAVDGSANPFTTLSSMGHTMNNIGMGVWWAGMGMYTASEVVRGGSPGITKGATSLIYAPLTYMVTTLVPVMASMLTLGFTLAYVIPFLPIMTWIIMVIGYLVTTIEAVVASPLAVILMVTPEGEGISGTRLERAMQLITMAVLKPSLMVIGVIASFSVSYVAFAVVNRFFWETAEYVLHGSVLDIIAVVSIYVIISFQVVRLLVSVMYRLPDQILDWFSSGVGRQFGENEVGGMAEKTGDQMKAGAQSVSGSASKLIGERRRNAMYQRSREQSDQE